MAPADLETMVTEINLMGMRRWLEKELMRAFYDARKGKLKTEDENKFEVNAIRNILRLADTVLDRTYEPGSSIAFVVFEPMVREIFAAPFRDRVIHHFLYNMHAGWWDARFIYDSYSCRVGKGTLLGIQRVQKFMRSATHNMRDKAYVMKLDLKGYFMSIPRARLLKRIKWGLDRQFDKFLDDEAGQLLYDVCLFLWTQVIMDDPVKKARRRGPRDNWRPEILPPEKSLYQQKPGYGLVIGNLTSQLSSNIYLDQLDRFIVHDLGYKYYGRYVDDFLTIVREEDWPRFKQDVKRIEQFVSEELDLTLHPKKRYAQPVHHGVPFLGARVYPHCLYPSDRLQGRFRKTMREFRRGWAEFDSVQAYIGLMTHMDTNTYIREVFEELGWGGDFWDF